MTDPAATVPASVTVDLVLVRADGTVHNLGVCSAHYTNPLKQAWWLLVGQHRANHRIRRANRHLEACGNDNRRHGDR